MINVLLYVVPVHQITLTLLPPIIFGFPCCETRVVALKATRAQIVAHVMGLAKAVVGTPTTPVLPFAVPVGSPSIQELRKL